MKRRSKIIQKDTQYILDGGNLSVFDEHEIVSRQKKLGLLYHHCLDHNQAKVFSKIKYRQNIYEIGEYVHLYDRSEENPYVVKLTGIIKIPDSYQKLPFLSVEWLIKKQNLPSKKYEQYLPHFSVAQVFPSGQIQYVYVQSIKNKCFVLTDKEYEDLGSTADNIYFFRASYDRKCQKIQPQPSTWPSECICMMPVNPDLEYVQCSQCQKWFHIQCIKLDKKKLMESDYRCQRCINKK